jgi:hypothetical protein
MREACNLVWSVLVLLFQSRASLGAEIVVALQRCHRAGSGSGRRLEYEDRRIRRCDRTHPRVALSCCLFSDRLLKLYPSNHFYPTLQALPKQPGFER